MDEQGFQSKRGGGSIKIKKKYKAVEPGCLTCKEICHILEETTLRKDQ